MKLKLIRIVLNFKQKLRKYLFSNSHFLMVKNTLRVSYDIQYLKIGFKLLRTKSFQFSVFIQNNKKNIHEYVEFSLHVKNILFRYNHVILNYEY